jgi:FKBP-type peptidyl-prolyl cis-trans isomerase FkpA
MDKTRSRFVPGGSFAEEALESRIVLSGIGSHVPLQRGAAEIAGQVLGKAPTSTSLAVNAGTLGQPITFNVTVRAAARAGSPSGTVNILDHGRVIQTLTLSPSASTSGRSATGEATATLTQPPGGAAYFFGRHKLTAEFVPSGAFAKSTTNASFTVKPLASATPVGGVQVSTITPGSGPQIQVGQTANVLYTGYLAKNGQLFDDSVIHGGAPFSFKLGAGQVVPGFDAGTAGMQAGESRIILIPASEGYGSTANGPIPGNSTLVFAVTLKSIS